MPANATPRAPTLHRRRAASVESGRGSALPCCRAPRASPQCPGRRPSVAPLALSLNPDDSFHDAAFFLWCGVVVVWSPITAPHRSRVVNFQLSLAHTRPFTEHEVRIGLQEVANFKPTTVLFNFTYSLEHIVPLWALSHSHGTRAARQPHRMLSPIGETGGVPSLDWLPLHPILALPTDWSGGGAWRTKPVISGSGEI